jgi:hypothetical protein
MKEKFVQNQYEIKVTVKTMKAPLVKFLLLNTLIAMILLVVFYFSAFLSGYGSSVNYLPQEKRLFIGFIIFHLLINLFLIYKYKQFTWVDISISILALSIFYFVEAWLFGYFK